MLNYDAVSTSRLRTHYLAKAKERGLAGQRVSVLLSSPRKVRGQHPTRPLILARPTTLALLQSKPHMNALENVLNVPRPFSQ